jgi:hypothetical protein
MTNPKYKELRERLCGIFGVFPEELEHDMPVTLGEKQCGDLMQLIEAELTEAEKRGRDKFVALLLDKVRDGSIEMININLDQLAELNKKEKE